MKKTVLLVSLFCVLASSLFSQVNFTFRSKLRNSSWGDVSNLWGYTAPNGTEYAIVGVETGVSIVDISDPDVPVEVQFLPGVNTIWREVKTFSHYAYVSNEGGSGVRIINLANLPGPVVYKDTTIGGIWKSHTVSETGGYLYMNGCKNSGGASLANGGTLIFDLNTNPWKPQYIGAYGTRYVHDSYIRGNYLYAGQINSGRFSIADITNKAAPVEVFSTTYNAGYNSFTHNTWLNDASTVCYTTDEVNASYVHAWDITDPSNATIIDKVRGGPSNGTAIAHNVHVKNDYILTSYFRDGVVVFDGARPHNLVEVGYYDTSPLYSGGNFNGCWGVFPYFNSGLVIASDIEEGLYVLEPNYTRACYLEGTVTNASTGALLSGVTVALSFQSANETTPASGEYAAGTVTPGTYTVTFSKAGFLSQTHTVSLTNGNLTLLDVALVPAVLGTLTVTVRNTANSPLSNAKVYLRSSGTSYSATTNASGVATISGYYDTYDVYAGRWGNVDNKVIHSFSPSSSAVIVMLQDGYYDDFIVPQGWTTSSTASAGGWTRAEPVGTFDAGYACNPELDEAGELGDMAYITGNAGGSSGNDDVDNGSVTLTSPVFDLTAYPTPIIRLSAWFANTGGSTAPNDNMLITLSNGITSATIWNLSGTGLNEWNQLDTDVSTFITPTANMQLTITVSDLTPGHIVEAGIDAFRVFDQSVLNAEKLKLSVKQSKNSNHLYWEGKLPEAIHTFDIERSEEGQDFETLSHQTLSSPVKECSSDYQDEKISLNSHVYYRVKATSTNGNAYFSPVVEAISPNAGIYLYPNPSSLPFVHISTPSAGKMIVRNTLGQKVAEKMLDAGLNQVELSDLSLGVYTISISNEAEVFSTKWIYQK